MNEQELNKTERNLLKRPTGKLIQLIQEWINYYIKLRDAEHGCISCVNGKVEQAGHYIDVGSSEKMRFDLDNIHGQCVSCNYHKGGNKVEYRMNLVKKIGEKRVKALEQRYQYFKRDTSKWDKIDLLMKRREIMRLVNEVK